MSNVLKVMLHGTICHGDFKCNTVLQHCCDIVSNSCNIGPTLQRSVALKIVVANRPVQHHLNGLTVRVGNQEIEWILVSCIKRDRNLQFFCKELVT